jgi:hypothetical protein
LIVSEHTLKGRPQIIADRLTAFAATEKDIVVAFANESVTPCATVIVFWVIDGGIVICVMLTVLGEVEGALGVSVTDQFGTPVKMVVSHCEVRATCLRY